MVISEGWPVSFPPLIDMHEHVALDPRVCVVEVQNIVAGPDKDIVDKLDNGPVGAVASGEVDHVVVVAGYAGGSTEVVVLKDAAPAAQDAAGPVDEFEVRRA